MGDVNIIKSPLDKKEYKYIVLGNGLKVLLVSESKLVQEESDTESEAETDEDQANSHTSSTDSKDSRGGGVNFACSACALCVRAGSFHDPPELPGLAHLLEHMLFMGSQKYPGENEFDSFISQHGGSNDASTDYETTMFYFEINKRHFKEALDKFAHFFICPLLQESSLEKEIEAVDSEFHNSYQSDSNRLQQLLCSLAADGHPLRNFPWGNRDTLKISPQQKGINVTEHLREFYHSYYSASYMTLAVVSEDPLEVLQDWVQYSFRDLPSNGRPFPSINHYQTVFSNENFHRMYKIIPVKDTDKLILTWLLPSLYPHYREKPVGYLSSLIGHEGYGSIMSLLKEMNLATGLVAGCGSEDYENNSSFSLFTCSVYLTENGVKHFQEVLLIIFQYLKLLHQEGPQERYYKEIQTIEKNSFIYEEEDENVELVQDLCGSMIYYLPSDILIGSSLYLNFDPEIISTILSYLSPDKCNIRLISRSFSDECHKKADWFNTLYSDEKINDEWIALFQDPPPNPRLHLPRPNTFIPTDFDLISDNDAPKTKYPILIDETSYYKLWYKKDDIFDLPKASICLLLITSQENYTNIKNFVMMELFVGLFNSTVTELVYEATEAQYKYSVGITSNGLSVEINGFSHKLSELFKVLVEFLSKFDACESFFQMRKEYLVKKYKNLNIKPDEYCGYMRRHLLMKHRFLMFDCLSALHEISLEDYRDFVMSFRSRLYIEALIQGNFTTNDSKNLMKFLISCWDYIPLPFEQRFMQKSLRLPSNSHVQLVLPNHDPSSSCTSITDYYQFSVADPREQVLTELLTDLMSEPCFDSLRTNKQLGYTVYVSYHNYNNVSGFSINLTTQEHKYSADYVSCCMNDFIYEFIEQLKSYTNEMFYSHVDSLIDAKEQADVCLEEEVTRNWEMIVNHTYQFNLLEEQVESLEKITKSKFIKWLTRYVQLGVENYRKLTVKIVSQHHMPLLTCELSNVCSSYNEDNTSCPTDENSSSTTDSTCGAANVIDLNSSWEIEQFKNTLKKYPS